ncbi:MAG TPA: class I SAM-dependent methyltransferase [Rhizomicrobium sp.]|jgi:ubiquinone/menaquinone biosynthesis C-methylase UbiE
MHDNVSQCLAAWGGQYGWSENGDEWKGQAVACGVSYEAWKESLIRNLIAPHVNGRSVVLEIAPGHGRWTEYLAASAAHVTAVDISAACLDYCRNRFQDQSNVDYFLTTGDRLPRAATGQIDFVWSYDSFVHIHRDLIRGYMGEIRRVLSPGGEAIIHHSNIDDIEGHEQKGSAGWRSAMNIELMRIFARETDLTVMSHFTYWDEERKIGVPRFGDRITHLRRSS